MLLIHALALSANQFFNARKSPYEYVQLVIIELTKLILVGTRITYQATRDIMLYGEHRNRQNIINTPLRQQLKGIRKEVHFLA